MSEDRKELADLRGWQPIETAPKDGAEILIGWPDDVQIGWWERSRGYFGWHEASSPRTMQPTHWRPLPAPPESNRRPQP